MTQGFVCCQFLNYNYTVSFILFLKKVFVKSDFLCYSDIGYLSKPKDMIMSLPLSKISNESLVTLTLPPNYGYCVLVAVSSVGVLAWKAAKVEQARKLYKISHPKMYSDTNNHFNCIQRAHQNSVENYPQFLTLLLLGGLDSPVWCAAGGVVYLLGRIFYAHGYYSGDPKKRIQGFFGHAGLVLMLGATVKLALKLLQLI